MEKGDREDAAERRRVLEEADDDGGDSSFFGGGASADSLVGEDVGSLAGFSVEGDDDDDDGEGDEDYRDNDAEEDEMKGGDDALRSSSALEEHVRRRSQFGPKPAPLVRLDKVDVDGDGTIGQRDAAFARAFDLDADGKLDDATLERVRQAQARNYPAEERLDPALAPVVWPDLEEAVWDGRADAVRAAFEAAPLSGDAALSGRAATVLLMAACQAGDRELAGWLAGEAGADVGARNQRGQTPLLMAAEFGNWEVVGDLAGRFSADIEAHDSEYHTAMSLGMRHPADSLPILLGAGAKIPQKYFAAALGESMDANRFTLAGFLYGYHHSTIAVRPYIRRLFRLARGFKQETTFVPRLFFQSVKAGWRLNQRPLSGALKLSGLFRTMAAVGDASERHLFKQFAAYFEDRAVWLLEFVESKVQLSLLLEERPRAGVDGTPLDLALEHRCFAFVTHPRVNQIVHDWWRPFPLDTSSLLRNPAELFRTPQVKFAMDGASFLCFMALWFVFVAERKEIADPVTRLEQGLFLYAVGFIVGEVQQLWTSGAGSYLQSGWNMADAAISVSIMATAACRGPDWSESWRDTLDPVYIGAVCTATLAFTVRSLFLLADVPALGPLLLSLRKMGSDVFLFSLLQLVSLAGLFFAFDFVINGDPALDGAVEGPEGYENTESMLLTLFQGGLAGEPSTEFDRLSTSRRVYAEILSSLHLLVNGVVLINLLIALMGNTFDSVKSRSDEEFVFSRVNTHWDYDQSLNALPPPFNLIVGVLFCVTWPFFRLYNFLFPQRGFDATASRRRPTLQDGASHSTGGGGGGGGGRRRSREWQPQQKQHRQHKKKVMTGGLRAPAPSDDAHVPQHVELAKPSRLRTNSDEVTVRRRNLPWQYCFYCHRTWTYGHLPPESVTWTAKERFPHLHGFKFRQRRYPTEEHRQVNRLFRSGAICSCVRLRKLIRGDRYYFERISVGAFVLFLWVPVVIIYSSALYAKDFLRLLCCCGSTDSVDDDDDEDVLQAATVGRGARAGVGLRPGSFEDQLSPFKGIRVPEPHESPVSRVQAAGVDLE